MARERFVRRGGTLAMHRHGRNIPGGMSAQQKRCSVQLKRRPDICKMRFGPGPPHPLPTPPLLYRRMGPMGPVAPAASRAHAITANFA